MVAPRVFLDFSVDGAPIGRVIFELYNVSAPKTAEKALCTGEKGLSQVSQLPLYYKNSIIHRSIKDFMIQGGDFTKRNGTGGESIFGGTFADEDLSRPVDEAGLLCMANKGPNTNGSQFFVTLKPCPHLNGKHVVFGRVVRGFEDVIQKITQVPTDEKDRPSVPVVISNCGELVLRRPPPKRSPSPVSVSSAVSEDERETKRRRRRTPSRSRSRSLTPLSEVPEREVDEDHSHNRKKHSKKHKSKKSKKSRQHSHVDDGKEGANDSNGEARPQREETEEEYDARLEREERERIESERRRELELIKEKYERERTASEAEGGVRFKGRGRMKFIDPEIRSRDYHKRN